MTGDGQINKLKVKVKRKTTDIEILSGISPPWEITRHMGSHNLTCHLAEVTFPPLPQPKLVLGLATLKGCKAKLTWVVVTSQDSLRAKDGHLSQK